MKLYDFLFVHECDEDVYDNTYDECVTVSMPSLDCEDEWENYERFIVEVCKRVDLIGTTRYGLIADWAGFIERNIELLKAYADKNWYKNQYDGDDEEFIYQWIRELHLWFAGYVDEGTYAEFLNEYLCKMS